MANLDLGERRCAKPFLNSSYKIPPPLRPGQADSKAVQSSGKCFPTKLSNFPRVASPEPAANASRQHMSTVVKERYARFDSRSSTSSRIARRKFFRSRL